MVSFDAMQDILYEEGFSGMEGEAGVNMEGMYCREVYFDCFRLHLADEVSGPGEHSRFRGWEDGAIGIVQTVELGIENKLLLSSY